MFNLDEGMTGKQGHGIRLQNGGGDSVDSGPSLVPPGNSRKSRRRCMSPEYREVERERSKGRKKFGPLLFLFRCSDTC